MLTSTNIPLNISYKFDIPNRYRDSVLWPIWQGFRARQGAQPRSTVPFLDDLERCKEMTLLAMDYSARAEKCTNLKIKRTLVSSHRGINLVHLLYDPSGCDESRLSSIEWQQILPFLVQIGCDLEMKNPERETPFLLAASYLKFRCIKELSKQGVDTSVKDACGNCAFDVVTSRYRDTYWNRDRSSDLSMTIEALLTAGCNPDTCITLDIDFWFRGAWPPPDEGNVDAKDLYQPFRNLDLGPDDCRDRISEGTEHYVWYCCNCGQFNSRVLNPSCIGSNRFAQVQLCDHRCCKDCRFDLR